MLDLLHHKCNHFLTIVKDGSQECFQELCHHCFTVAKTQSSIEFRNSVFSTNPFSVSVLKFFSKKIKNINPCKHVEKWSNLL